ncbi:MAG: sarcosine oxidase subunit gamma [Pseudomonadota bacterium]
MAELDFKLDAAPTLGGLDRVIGANRLVECADMALVSIAIPLGGDTELSAALSRAWQIGVPSPTRSNDSGSIRAIRSAPDQLLLLFPHSGPDAAETVATQLGDTGYVTDQTDGNVFLEISGPQTAEAMERICPIDLAPEAFPPGASARTMMEHLGVWILCLGPQSFLLWSPRSSARSFLHAIETSYHHVTGQ